MSTPVMLAIVSSMLCSLSLILRARERDSEQVKEKEK